MIRRLVLIGMILILPTVGVAEEKAPPKRTRAATAKESEAARRERLKDLERRVRALEQRYEMTEPQVPASGAPPAAEGRK